MMSQKLGVTTYREKVDEWMLALYGLNWEQASGSEAALRIAMNRGQEPYDFCLYFGNKVGLRRI